MDNKITIHGRTLDYDPEKLSYENSTILDKQIARENLLLFKKIAVENNLHFLIYYGTLLGAIREKDFISHDIDIDVVTNDEDKLLDIIPLLISNGFKFIRYETCNSLKTYTTLYSFKRKTVYIDVYIAYKEKRKYNLLGSYIKKSFIEKTVEYEFLDTSFEIPKQYLKILKILYGKTWEIPIKDKPGDFPRKSNIKSKLKHIIKICIPKSLFAFLYKYYKKIKHDGK